MIEKRLVQWYAADSGVDLDIAEREVVLTYVLRLMLDAGLLQHLAFKGGTAIRKLYLGGQGRFSLDLDFTALGAMDPEGFILDVVGALHDHTHYGLTFSIPPSDYYATSDSCGAEVTYRHEWMAAGRFGLQISFRSAPMLPVRPQALRPERYFEWLGIQPPEVPSLVLSEILGEKIRAAAQRSRARDVYDLYQLAHQRYDRELVRRIAVLKCWETRWAFDPKSFLASLAESKYDGLDLRRLVKRGSESDLDTIIRGVQNDYGFLAVMTPEEAALAADPYGRQKRIYKRLLDELKRADISDHH
jgi:predicted nucleotidyltransferase component of viral defense system